MPAATILVWTWYWDTQEGTFNSAWVNPKKMPQRRCPPRSLQEGRKEKSISSKEKNVCITKTGRGNYYFI